jgi:hypothetical protein
LLFVPDHIRTIAFVALGVANVPASWDEHMRRPVLRYANRYGTPA